MTSSDHVSVEPGINLRKAAPDRSQSLIGLDAAISASPVDASLLEIAKFRASQVNGRAFRIEMDATAAMRASEPAVRLLTLDAWRKASLFAAPERAPLELTEARARPVNGSSRAACGRIPAAPRSARWGSRLTASHEGARA